MNDTATIVSAISVIACLVLVLRHGGLRSTGSGEKLRLALIWLAIIVGVVLAVRITGLAPG